MRARATETAPRLSHPTRLVKLADKAVNLNDLIDWRPAGWPPARKASYVEWSADVIAGIRVAHRPLEHAFDSACVRRPNP